MARRTTNPSSRSLTVERQPTWPTMIGISMVLVVVAFVAGMRLQTWAPAWLIGTQNGPQFARLERTYEVLKGKFAEGQLTDQRAYDGAAHGLVSSLGDPYTVYLTAAEARAFDDALSGTFSGIGAELAKKHDQLIIQSVLDDSPAQHAGLRGGDAIKQVNGESTDQWSIEKAATTIRGEAGTTVKLSIQRDKVAQDISVTRANVTNPSVRSSVSGDGIGYMRISRFSDADTTNLAQKAADTFKEKHVRGVILDLRGNGGGSVDAAQAVASLWIDSGKTIVTERKDSKVVATLSANGEAQLAHVPTVVLIDGYSASASEIVAGALHDYGLAKLVGQKSFGKGSVQEIIDLDQGAKLKVTVALWYTPNGKNINKQGIQPDTNIQLTDQDMSAGNDPQKAKAEELLK